MKRPHKATIEVTYKQAFEMADALNAQAKTFDGYVANRPNTNTQTLGIWKQAAEDRREMARNLITPFRA